MKNGTLKPSVVITPQSILLSLKDDIQTWAPSTHLSQDIDYLIRRYESEGDAFICVTMPLLGKAIETSLVQALPLAVPYGWRLKKGTRLPRHFYIYFSYIYNDDGSLKATDENNRTAVQLLRQLFLFWSKRDSNTTGNDDIAIEKFMARITKPRTAFWEGLEKQDLNIKQSLGEARKLLHVVFDRQSDLCEPLRLFIKEPWGRHGPGAVAEHECAADKWKFIAYKHLPTRLFTWANEEATWPKAMRLPSSRVVTVPKDFRGPRIICIEPKEFQFGQQGLMELLYGITHRHYLTRRSIRFDSVEQSQKLCFNNSFATIDLKDASDSISLELVKYLFPKWIYKLLVRYRTPMVNNTSSTCYATMGSALCFPVQTLTFWALCRGSIKVKDRKNLRYRGSTHLRVFGDDIIVPVWCADHVCNVLTACGLEINPNKTCIRTNVREACGEWVYAGLTNRIQKPRRSRISSYTEWSAIVDAAQNFLEKGYMHTSALLKSYAFEFYRPQMRHGKNLQRAELRVPSLTKRRAPHLEGYAGLYAWYVHSNVSPFSRGTQSRVKWGWVRQDTKYLV